MKDQYRTHKGKLALILGLSVVQEVTKIFNDVREAAGTGKIKRRGEEAGQQLDRRGWVES